MNSDPFLIAVGIIGARELTDELLKDVLGMLPRICPDLADEDLNNVKKQLESTIGISMVPGQGLHGGDQEPWLEEVKASTEWNYWNAYKQELQSNGLAREVIRVLDEDTENILDECGNPKTDVGWRVQGLVMGDVQSGKTASYCGLINKAADVGYKIIILLTGMTEELRGQTQERMDAGFVGMESNTILAGERGKKAIGTGRFRSAVPNVLTSIEFDFLTKNKDSLRGIPLENIHEPVLLVMKKNKSPLQNLISFLDTQMKRGHQELDLPLLLVDDEADNASVNAKKDEDPATINRLIREILNRFVKSAYVAYTATPFANVFINPDETTPLGTDLFPKNFIYCLNTPDNYIGVASIFSEFGSHRYQLQDLDDAAEIFPYKHKKDWKVQMLPRSLQEAVETFLLSCAIRDLREEPRKHRSMLVNVSRFVDVQGKLATVLKNYLDGLTDEIKQYLAVDDVWYKHPPLKTLHETWHKHYEAQESWDRIRKVLYESIASVKVLTINQKSEEADRLNYRLYQKSKKGRRVIAVGGQTLSRGLTLEGLCISYFYRNSKAYDTLLQMGRWFGYRPGYDDLCRVWMDPDVQQWFEYLARVVAELKLDIRRMSANRQPPSRFGMRVRSHPDALVVTALNKMRNSQEVEIYISFSEAGAETPFLPKDVGANQRNVSAVSRFIDTLGPAELVGSSKFYWKKVDAARIGSFLGCLEISNMNMHFMTDIFGEERPLLAFINSNCFEKLDYWDVCLPQGSGDLVRDLTVQLDDGKTNNIRPRKRQFEKVPAGTDYLKLNKQRVGEIADEMVYLSAEKIEAAKCEWEEMRRQDPDKGITVPGYLYRRYRERPLLTVHIIQPQNPKDDSERKDRMMRVESIEPKLLVAVGLSFPKFPDEDPILENEESGLKYDKDKVRYQINKVALRNMGLIDQDDEDDDED